MMHTQSSVAATPAARRRLRLRHPFTWAFALLALAAVLAMYAVPFLWMISTALKPSAEIYTWPIRFFTQTLSLDNFSQAWEAAPFGRYFANSVIVTVVATFAKTVLAITTAYAFTFFSFRGRDALFLVMLGALMVPGHVTLLVNYVTVANLGLINTFAGIILPGVGSAFGTFLLRQRFRTLPAGVLEAAEIDGAGHLRRLWSFVIPMSRSAIATVALLAAVDAWNDFIWPLLVTNTDAVRTLPISLMHLKTEDGVTDWGIIMAGTTLIVFPVLVLFLFAQRAMIQGFAAQNSAER